MFGCALALRFGFVSWTDISGVLSRRLLTRTCIASVIVAVGGVAASVGVLGLLSSSAESSGPHNPVVTTIVTTSHVGETILGFCLAVLVTPVAEECVYRGAAFALVRKSYGAAVATCASVVLFTLSHPVPGQWMASVVLAALACSLRMSEGTLVAPIVLHSAWNAAVWTGGRFAPPSAFTPEVCILLAAVGSCILLAWGCWLTREWLRQRIA